VLWVIYGYSLAFTGGQRLLRRLRQAVPGGRHAELAGATFSKGVYIPEYAFIAFQDLRRHHPGADRRRVRRAHEVLGGAAVHGALVHLRYLPMAHMVWYWDGPDAITDAATLRRSPPGAGWLWAKGALDFAGGTVVHINAGIAGLVGAYMIGKRIGYGREAMAPHSLTLTMVGASLLWVGWFGFNAGSNLEANGLAALAMVNTFVATAAAVLSWMFAEWMGKGKPSMLGAASGAVAGLVAITPACGFVGPMGAIVIGLSPASSACGASTA
jgi:ammonium transporter, Amt family